MLPDEADALVRRTGLRTVIDLRGADEAPADLGPLADRASRHHLPMWDDELEADERAHRFAEPVAFLTQNYARLAERYAIQLALAATILGDPEAWPAVVHCAGGKDRTGLAVALILESIGVDEDAIVLDYLASEREAQRAFAWRARDRGGVADGPRPSIDVVQAPALRATLAAIRATHGSARGFLTLYGTATMAFDVIRGQLLGAP